MFSLLHIDNNFFYRDLLHRISVERDFKYFSAKTPEKAYDILEKEPIDVIITGLDFLGVADEVFVSRLMALKKHSAAVIVLSSAENPMLKTKLFDLGITEFIEKSQFLDYFNFLITKLEVNDLIVSKLQNLNIAVLDDSESHLKLTAKILTHHHIHKVDYYQHPRELLESAKRYDIYLVDYILPHMTGDQVISELRRYDEYAVIIAVSSISSPAVISNILMSGADDFVNKPFSSDVLMARLKANVRTYFLMEQLKIKNEQLSRMATEDGLTGLYNHRHIIEMLEVEIDRSKRYGSPLSILMFDLDRFKVVNDTYGHHIGDVVLAYIGAFWSDKSRVMDIAGRYGGEEFLVILPNTPLEGAKIYAERLREAIAAAKISEEAISVTISGGLATFQNETALELIQMADEKLYLAKNNGRNRIEC